MIKVSDTASKKIIDMMSEDGFDAAQELSGRSYCNLGNWSNQV